jgi:hypothetical protein
MNVARSSVKANHALSESQTGQLGQVSVPFNHGENRVLSARGEGLKFAS